MIDLDEIESAARKPWYCRSKLEDNLLSPEALVELITRLRKAEKDAARYRFMRDMSDDVDVSRFFHVEISERDAEIDEAMQCNK